MSSRRLCGSTKDKFWLADPSLPQCIISDSLPRMTYCVDYPGQPYGGYAAASVGKRALGRGGRVCDWVCSRAQAGGRANVLVLGVGVDRTLRWQTAPGTCSDTLT